MTGREQPSEGEGRTAVDYLKTIRSKWDSLGTRLCTTLLENPPPAVEEWETDPRRLPSLDDFHPEPRHDCRRPSRSSHGEQRAGSEMVRADKHSMEVLRIFCLFKGKFYYQSLGY